MEWGGGDGSAGKQEGWGLKTRGHAASPCTCSLRCTHGGLLHSQDSCLERQPFFSPGPC